MTTTTLRPVPVPTKDVPDVSYVSHEAEGTTYSVVVEPPSPAEILRALASLPHLDRAALVLLLEDPGAWPRVRHLAFNPDVRRALSLRLTPEQADAVAADLIAELPRCAWCGEYGHDAEEAHR